MRIVAMPQTTIRQHYVSAGYLAGFTKGGTRNSIFYVHPADGSPSRIDKPVNVASEKHYNDINVDGFTPDYLETVFKTQFEDPAHSLFKTLSGNPGRPFQTENELITAYNFLALQAARVPQTKDAYEKLIIQNGQAFLHDMAYSPHLQQRLHRFSSTLTVAEMQEAVNSGQS
jgi:hypothetical protein